MKFHVSGPTGWLPLCEAPCTADVAPRANRPGASMPGGAVVPAPAVTLSGNARVTAHYQSRRGRRLVGLGTLLGGLAAGGIVFGETNRNCAAPAGVVPEAAPLFCRNEHPYALLGVGIVLVGLLAGMPMLLQRDEVSLSGDVAGSR